MVGAWVASAAQCSAAHHSAVQCSAGAVLHITVGWTAVKRAAVEWRRMGAAKLTSAAALLPACTPPSFSARFKMSINFDILVGSVCLNIFVWTPGSHSLNWLLVKLNWGHCRHRQLSRVNRYEKQRHNHIFAAEFSSQTKHGNHNKMLIHFNQKVQSFN